LFGDHQGDPPIVRYEDSNYVGGLDNKRSIIRYVFTLAGGLIVEN